MRRFLNFLDRHPDKVVGVILVAAFAVFGWALYLFFKR